MNSNQFTQCSKDINLNIASKIINRSVQAFREYCAVSHSGREEIISAIKEAILPIVPELAKMERFETGMGCTHDKEKKLLLALQKTPGLEVLTPRASMSDDGVTLFEYSAYGVICATQPATNPCATTINNVIGMICAGNSVIVISHPRSQNVSQYLVSHINAAISAVSGIDDLVVTLDQSSFSLAVEVMGHPDVAMVVATGGGKLIGQALSCSKRVIAAGSANPVAMVDETADLSCAAENISSGASFNNNITCVGEKNIVVVSKVADVFVNELKENGVHYVSDHDDMLKLTKAAINNNFMMNRSLAGKSAKEILKAADIQTKAEVKLIVVETPKTHPFVTIEMLMPLVPLVRADDFEDMLETALFIEHGHRHTATIHSQSIVRLNRAAQVMQTSVFVKNGSSISALGLDGGGYAGFTIANITGEGIVTAQNFARSRRC